MDLSIIVPVYNVEEYIRPCLESIFKQGLNDDCFEVIIVNDDTKDRSMEVIADIISQHNNITVIYQENQGLSVARNNGIAAAKGEYILMPDSDDLLIENSLSQLLKKALHTKADLIVADSVEIYLDEELPDNSIQKKEFLTEEKDGEHFFIEELNPYYCQVWRALYRREFLINNDLKFVPGIFFQDIPFTHECYIKAKKCIRALWTLNIYRRGRNGAATASFSDRKAQSFIIALANTWELRKLKELSADMKYKLEENLYLLFYSLVYKTIHSINKVSERNKTIDLLKDTIPHLYFDHTIKQRVTTVMINYCPHLFINIYYLYAQIVWRKFSK